MGNSIKRSAFATFLNTTPLAAATYELVGEGITAAQIEYNPQTLEETYISQDSGSVEVESYRPTMPIEATAKKGDGVFDFVETLRKNRAVLDAAKSDIVNVWMYETPTGTVYPAEKQTVSIQIDSFGGEGGGSAKINYTINFVGAPVVGTFDTATNTFA